MINSGSYSRLSTFEKCKYRAYLAYDQKIPELERPALPKGQEYPNDRGDRIHKEAEAYVRGNGAMPREMAGFTTNLEQLKQLYKLGLVSLEGDWEFDKSWKPILKKGKKPFVRVKLDWRVQMDPGWSVVGDYKSGRRDGNEVAHADQTRLYALAEFIRQSQVMRITTELWYIDHDLIIATEYNRNQMQHLLSNYNERMVRMTSATLFPPNPSTWTCSFCPFKCGYLGKTNVKGTGHCDKNP